MKTSILVRRYTQGLVSAIKDEAEFSAIEGGLSLFAKLLEDNQKLKEIVASPFLAKKRKREMIKEILAKLALHMKAERFVLLLLEKDRFALLDEIVQLVPVLWNESKGVSTYEVASVIPLSREQKSRLEANLKRLEKKPVTINFVLKPELVGGLWIKKGNTVYDVSIRGHVLKLKEKICEG